MKRRVRVILLCFTILIVLTLACGGHGKKYSIAIAGGKTYLCNCYEWEENDLLIFDCGISGYNKVIASVVGSNVTIVNLEEKQR